MSFHGQRLRQVRAIAGLDPLPDSIYRAGFVRGFYESIDPKFYSPAARHWYDEVSEYVLCGAPLPASERDAFCLVSQVLKMARDERDGKKRLEFLMPSSKAQHDFNAARLHRAAEAVKASLLEKELQRRGYRYGPDYDELSHGTVLPSADGLFDRAMAAEYGETEGAVKQKRLRWRAAHERLVRASV